ncbi:recombinase [Streptomyces laurentii]|uniref:Recombinase n=1 Tax=Streptomyces laurentii TaxID=39478 RepID=A0A160NUX6_STRLU|nr:recombinase [Streptomyces laurentii]
MGKTAERLGEARPLASVADDEIGGALEQLWGEAAVNTWNARRAAVLSWLGWCAERGYEGPQVPAWVKRMAPPDSDTAARSKMAIDRLIARRDVRLREKTVWRMLYETVARPGPAPRRQRRGAGPGRAPGPGEGEGCPAAYPAPGRLARGLRAGDRVRGCRHRPPAAPAPDCCLRPWLATGW